MWAERREGVSGPVMEVAEAGWSRRGKQLKVSKTGPEEGHP